MREGKSERVVKLCAYPGVGGRDEDSVGGPSEHDGERWLDVEAMCVHDRLGMHSHLCTGLYGVTT